MNIMRNFKTAIADAIAATAKIEQERAERRGVSPTELRELTEQEQDQRAQLAALAESGIQLAQGDDRAIVDKTIRRTRALEIVDRWAGDPKGRPILVLSGAIGTGKTLAAGVLVANAKTGRVIAARQLSETVIPFAAEIARGVQPLNLTARLLVLDDLGTEDPKRDRRWTEAFATFIDARQCHGRTLITSNLKRADFRERYDARIVSRLNASAKAVELVGESMRAKGGGL